MVTVGVLIRLEAKPGKEEAVLSFLKSACPLAEDEADTVTWQAFRMGPRTFGIFTSFETEVSRQHHLNGNIAVALAEQSESLFAQPPAIEEVAIIAAKVPEPPSGTIGFVPV